jgi:hypothetical protein
MHFYTLQTTQFNILDIRHLASLNIQISKTLSKTSIKFPLFQTFIHDLVQGWPDSTPSRILPSAGNSGQVCIYEVNRTVATLLTVLTERSRRFLSDAQEPNASWEIHQSVNKIIFFF